jgi:hypothetical protein
MSPSSLRPHSLRRNLALLALGSLLAAALFGLPRGAEAEAPTPETGRPRAAIKRDLRQRSASIPRALGVYVTERGQRYFADNLLDLIERKGYSLDQGTFPGWAYQAEEPIVLDSLPVEMRSRLEETRALLTRWLRGFELKDPLIRAETAEISYGARFSRFGLRLDKEATARLRGQGGGIALVFEAEAPELRVETDQVAAWDLNNAFLGDFGVKRPWVGLSPSSAPLRLSIPIAIRIRKSGELSFDVGKLGTNLPELALELGMDRPLKLPRVTVKINGQTLTLNQARLEEKLLEQRPRLLEALQSYLDEHARLKLPPFVSQLVNESYAELMLTDVNEMDPPGAGQPTSPSERYRWGLRTQELRATDDHVAIGMSMFVDDPKARDPRAEVSRRHVTRPPALGHINPATYDLALAINEDLVNRILGLNFQRGYNPVIEVSGQDSLELVEAPEFRFTSESTSDRGKLHVKVRHQADGKQERLVLLGNQVTFEMDLNVRLIRSREGKLSVAVDSIDVDSLSVYVGSVMRGTRNKVIDRIAGKLESANSDLAKNPKVIADALPIPSQVGGIPIRIKDFRADPHGYLVLYLEYDLSQ